MALLAFLLVSAADSQGPPPGPRANTAGPPGADGTPPPPPRLGPGRGGPGRNTDMARWWSNPQLAESIGINSDQKKKLEDLFQQHRLSRIDLTAALEKAQVTMEPLMAADQPNEAQIVAQIDRVAQARAAVEKDEVRLQIGIRQVLTADQWKKLQEQRPEPRGPNGPGGRSGPDGPGGRGGRGGPPPR
ncbi:MAG: Spy/CpxP family protein refolding chaperone [Terriglobia bacterium]